jgi:hypothetical protein
LPWSIECPDHVGGDLSIGECTIQYLLVCSLLERHEVTVPDHLIPTEENRINTRVTGIPLTTQGGAPQLVLGEISVLCRKNAPVNTEKADIGVVRR